MTPNPVLSNDMISKVVYHYITCRLSVKEVANILKVSPDAVESFIKRHKIPKRNKKEAQQAKFLNKPLSFVKQKLSSIYLKELSAIGTMLYWAEGYKGDERNGTVDFANSDTRMVKLFMVFLRKIFKPREERFRVYLYCYSDQDVSGLIKYWSKATRIPIKQFSKPYVRSDYKKDGRKMEHGMIHIRYHDKKLLLELKSMIESYVLKYA